LVVVVVEDITEVAVVLVDSFGMDHQHQQRLQMEQQSLTVTAQHTP